MQQVTLGFLMPRHGPPLKRPLLVCSVSAGFPSPADDYLDARLDLNEHLIKHPTATFFVRVSGDSMRGAGIYDGDLVVVDRAAQVANGCIVVARIEDAFTLKRFRKTGRRVFLVAENEIFPPIEVTEGSDFEVWGRVVASIRKY